MDSLRSLKRFAKRWQGLIALSIALASTIILALGLSGDNQGDVAWYQWMISDWLGGKLPYLGHVVEYPPYALGLFYLPWLLGAKFYLFNFMILALVADVMIKVILFVIAGRSKENPRAYWPLAFYSVAVVFISYLYLQRFDVWPALLVLMAIWLFWKNKFMLSGIFLAVAIGVKLYPAVFFVPLLIMAIRKKSWLSFVGGVVLGLAPLAIIGEYLPWWNFLQFQGSRGLQVESFYASLIWFFHHLGLVDATWIRTTAWYEVQGTLSSLVASLAKYIFVIANVWSALFAAWAIVRSKVSTFSISDVARLSLCVLLPFIVWNIVISPQYMIWLIPLAALSLLGGQKTQIFLLFVAIALTPLIYPVPDYFDGGLNLFHTVVLLVRNILLAVAWVWLMIEIYGKRK